MRRAMVVLAVVVLAAGCVSRADTGPEAPTPAPARTQLQPTAPQASESVPTPALDPVEQAMIAQERVDAAVAALDASIEAGVGWGGLASYQLRESDVDADGLVTLTLCGQRSDIEGDARYDSSFFTSIASDGAITAVHDETVPTAGNC